MRANDIITTAKNFLGKPYVWGGESDAEGGYDCSGLLYAVLRQCNYPCSRLTASGYSKMGTAVATDQMQAGDFLFFGRPVTHCAIYIGNGQMIESRGSRSNAKSNPGTGVVVSNVNRRSDLTDVRRFWDESVPVYTDGKLYTTVVDHLHVRYSPWGVIKEWSRLTAGGKTHAYSDGCLRKGTNVTCKRTEKQPDGSIWMQIPSGWVCAVAQNGEVYVK